MASVSSVLLAALIGSQQPATGVVIGRVTTRPDIGAAMPVADAIASIVGTTLGAVSRGDGTFVIARVPAGAHTLRVRHEGFRTSDRALRLRGGDTLRIDITLLAQVQVLSAMRADAQPADAELFRTRPQISTVTMGAAAMAGVPSLGEPDLVRVVQLLPGVVSRNDYNTGLTVRGGEADQNLILLDGHPIYNPFHLGGLFSTFMDATVGGIELLTGAFPARYGGRLSSVLDVKSAEDPRPGVHASADISVLAATGRLAGAFGDGRGSWSVAGRRTYGDALTRIFTDNVFPYHFRDFHGRATWTSGSVRMAVTGYSGKDVLDADFAEIEADSAPSRASEGQWAFDWGNRVIGASLAKDLTDRTTVEQRISTSGFATLLDIGDGAFAQRSTISDVRLSGSLLTRGDAHDRSLGYDIATYRVNYSSSSSQTGTSDFDLVQRPTSGALWVDDLWRLSSRWIIQGGLRAEALSGRNWAALSPRLSVKYFVTPELALTAGAGRVTQFQHSLAGDGPLRFFDVWIASDSVIPVSTAWHGVAGVERRVGDAGSIRVEGFYKRYDRVLEVAPSEDPAVRGDEFLPATGLSYGADLIARWQPNSGLSGWITYSYGLSSRTRRSLQWAPGHDRRNDVNVVGMWRMSRYKFGARFGFASGTPYTPIVGGIARRVYDPSRDRWGTGGPVIDIESIGGARNSARYPAVHRLDVDVSREFLRGGTSYAPYLSVVNAYNAQNVFVYLYQYGTDSPNRRAISQFPVLPSVGVRIVF